MATRGAMYISLWENSWGHPDNVSFMQFSRKIDGFEQKDSQGFENSYNSYEQYPLEKFFHFHHLPKLYFGFKNDHCTFWLFRNKGRHKNNPPKRAFQKFEVYLSLVPISVTAELRCIDIEKVIFFKFTIP